MFYDQILIGTLGVFLFELYDYYYAKKDEEQTTISLLKRTLWTTTLPFTLMSSNFIPITPFLTYMAVPFAYNATKEITKNRKSLFSESSNKIIRDFV